MKKQFVKDQMQRSPRGCINSEHLISAAANEALALRSLVNQTFVP